MHQRVNFTNLKAEDLTLRRGFHVTPTVNGGWVVTNDPEAGYVPIPIGAFTDDDDLIDFIIAELKPNLRSPGEVNGTEFVIDDSLDARIAQLSEASSDGN